MGKELPASLFILAVLPAWVQAETITVPNNEQTTVQQGIDAIVDATGTVIIKRGTYEESLVLKSGVTLQGEETAQVKIDSPDSGPAIDIEGNSNVTIRNLTIVDSSIGIQVSGNSSVDIFNSVFSLGTNATPAGTAIDIQDTAPTVTIRQNTFFANNVAIDRAEDSVIEYNLFHNNNTDITTGPGNSNVTFNCFDTGTGIGSNIEEIADNPVPPLFADQAAHDFHLQQGAPCIDSITNGRLDIIDNTMADIGAYGGPDMDVTPFPPQNLLSTVNNGVDPRTVSINWDQNLSQHVTSAGGYELHYSTQAPDTNNPVYSGGLTAIEGASPIELSAPTNAQVLSFNQSDLDTVGLALPVVSLAPSSGTIDVSWQTVPNATSYTLHFGASALTDNERTGITGTSFSITGLSNGTSYQVAVTPVHQPSLHFAVKTFDNTGTGAANANISEFSELQSVDFGIAVTGTQSAPVSAIPELVEPFPAVPGEGCFIATAAWGYYSAPQVQVLRDFRDRHLLTNQPGRAFVRWYYHHSPGAAGYLKENPQWKPLVRLLLYPLVLLAQFVMFTGLATTLLAFTGIVLAVVLVWQKRKMRKDRNIHAPGH